MSNTVLTYPDFVKSALTRLFDTSTPALVRYCLAKRIEDAMAKAQAELRGEANAEFEALRATSAQLTNWPIEDFAILTNNMGKGSWTLSDDILTKQAELDAEIAAFKKTHKATNYAEAAMDPSRTALFRITLL
jgi:uncharacterized membrane-anchored protein YhcB (DUF1043 family)